MTFKVLLSDWTLCIEASDEGEAIDEALKVYRDRLNGDKLIVWEEPGSTEPTDN